MSNHNIAGFKTLPPDLYFTTSDSALESAEIAAINVRSNLKKIKESNLNLSKKIAACEKLFPTIQQCITTLRNGQHNSKWQNNDEFRAEFVRTLATEANITVFQSDCAKKILINEWTLVEPILEKINSFQSNGASDSKINDANMMLEIRLQKIKQEYSSAMQIFRFQHKTLSKHLDLHKTILESEKEYYKIITDNLNASRNNILFYSSNNSENKATVLITLLKNIKLGDSNLVKANTALQECTSCFEEMIDQFQDKLSNSYFQNGTQLANEEKIKTCINMIGECRKTIHAANLLSKLYKGKPILQPYRELCVGIKNDFSDFESNIRFEFSHISKKSNIPEIIHNFELRRHLEQVKNDTNVLSQFVINIDSTYTVLVTKKDERTFAFEHNGDLIEYKQDKKHAWKKVIISEENNAKNLATLESQEKINELADSMEAKLITDETDLLTVEIEEHIGRLKALIKNGHQQELKCESYEKKDQFEYPASLFIDLKNKLESVSQNAGKLLDSYESVQTNPKKQSDFVNLLQTQLNTADTFIKDFRDRRVKAIKDQKTTIDKTCLKLLLNYGEIRSITKTVSKKPLAEKIGNSGNPLNPGFLDVYFIDINKEKKLELHVHYENSDDAVPISGAIHLKYSDNPNIERESLKLSINFFNQLFSTPAIKKIDTTNFAIDTH